MKVYLKAIATVGAVLFALSFVKVHAAEGKATKLNVHVKEMAKPPKYLVDGVETNAAEATIAVLQGKTALKCTEMEVEAGRNGLTLKGKKSN